MMKGLGLAVGQADLLTKEFDVTFLDMLRSRRCAWIAGR